MKGGESCPDRDRGIPALPPAEARPRGQKSPRWSAAGRASFAKDAHAARRELRMDAPCGAPSPGRLSRRTEGEDGAPGAAKNTGDDAWLFENLSGHSGARAQRANPE